MRHTDECGGRDRGGLCVRQACLWVIAAIPLMAVGIPTGCSRGPAPPQYGCQYLEDLFDPGQFSIMYTGGGSSYVSYRLKEGVDAQMATRAICAYLRHAPGAPQAQLDIWREPLPDGRGGLHVRDFWAKVLARLNGREFDVFAGRGPHEQEIAALVRTFPER